MRIQSQEFADRLNLGLIGALQGLVIWTLIEIREQTLTTALFAAILTFLLVSGAIVHFVWTGRDTRRLVGLAALIGAIYAVIAFWVALQLPESYETALRAHGDQDRVGTWIVASLLSLYVLGPFLQIYQRTSRARFPYPQLFMHSWSNFHIALVGALFVAVLWAVLGLWAALFNLLDIDFFSDLFTAPVFVWTVTGAAIGVGLSIGREREKLIATLRNITLSVFRTLLPLVAIVALMFLVAIPLTGLDTLWETRRASWILLTWVAYTILFINALYQDGNQPPPYAAALRRLVEAGLVAMTVFCVLALVGLSVRIEQHGLTPPRIRGLIVAGVLTVYILGYSVSVFWRRKEWLSSIRTANVWMAPVLVSLALLLHTPLLDPIGWSARNQGARLAEGRVDAENFDYAYLRFRLGQAGQRELMRLKELTAHPQREAILTGVAAAEQAQFYDRFQAKKLTLSDIVVYPDDHELPQGLVAAIRATLPGVFMQESAFDERPALILALDLDGRLGLEYLVFPPLNRFEGYAFRAADDDTWVKFGNYRPRVTPRDIKAFDADVAAGNIKTLVPEYLDVVIGEQRFQATPF